MIIKIINTIFPFTDFLYILQMEEYSGARYIYWLKRLFWKRGFQKRQHLVMTARAQIIYSMSIVLFACIWLVVLAILIPNFILAHCIPVTSSAYIPGFPSCEQMYMQIIIAVMLFAFSFVFIPLIVLLAHIITVPFFSIMKSRRMQKAHDLIATQNPGIKIIAIAGGYGKTSIKNYLFQLVLHSYRTQMIEGNINTPLGIADWVLTKLRPETQLLIVEMDTYHRGEIASSCSVTQPDIAILTNIGDQHLARFPSEADHVQALAEIFTNTKPGGLCVTRERTWDSISHLSINLDDRKRLLVHDDDNAYPDINEDTSHLNQVQKSNLILALHVAKYLDIPSRFVSEVIRTPLQVDRRGVVSNVYGYDGIDDSYNISFTTASISIGRAEAYAHDKRKKLLVVTAGIPELSIQNRDKNEKLGHLLAEKAHHTYILSSMFDSEIVVGFGKSDHFTVVKDLPEFVSTASKNHPPAEYVLLVLPELTDLYY
jgi:UDP-N-acetylmuramoyl-tripeptide--D-alanyl-D-alanine ligase